MRAVLQRVSEARVLVEGETVSEIGEGILALIGVAVGDTDSDTRYIADKIADLRLFEGVEEDSAERSLREIGGAALVVSQFTLMGDCRKGRRPSWSEAARPEEARHLYEAVVARLIEQGIPTVTGTFRTQMRIQLTNEGPFTVLVNSKKTF